MKKLFTKVVRAIAALVVVFVISIGTVSPASAASALGLSAEVHASAADPGSGTVKVSSVIAMSLPIELSVDGVVLKTADTLPGGSLAVPVVTAIDFSGVPSGKTLVVNAVVGTDRINLTNYLNDSAPATKTIGLSNDPTSVVVPAGTQSVGAHFIINQIGDIAHTPASISVVAGGETYQVLAEAITGGVAHYSVVLPAGVLVTSASAVIYYEWSGQFNLSHYTTVPLGGDIRIPLIPAPDFIDKCGRADDMVDYPDVLVEGLVKYVTGDQPDGTVVVTAIVKKGYVAPRNTPLTWTHKFTDEPCAPKPNTDSKPVAEAPVAPNVNQPTESTPVVTQAEATQGTQAAVASTNRNYTVRGAASGGSASVLSAWPPIAAGALVLMAFAAVRHRRSVTGASE